MWGNLRCLLELTDGPVCSTKAKETAPSNLNPGGLN